MCGCRSIVVWGPCGTQNTAVRAKKLSACRDTNRDLAVGMRERVRDEMPFPGAVGVRFFVVSSMIGVGAVRSINGTPPGVLFRVCRLCTNVVDLMLRFAVLGLRDCMIAGASVMRVIVRIGVLSITLCCSALTLCSSIVGKVGGIIGGGVRILSMCEWSSLTTAFRRMSRFAPLFG